MHFTKTAVVETTPQVALAAMDDEAVRRHLNGESDDPAQVIERREERARKEAKEDGAGIKRSAGGDRQG